ncbi:MAG: TldD/PmbA family protein [Dehalococcoidia bacterium]|nr:TldD/PmbA family protein [Dehalococcoidia bacterium]
MPQIDDIARQLASKFSVCGADYIEAHFEDRVASHITYRGKNLEGLGKSASIGGNIRALINGGWGFVSFNSFDNLDNQIKIALEGARLAGNNPSIRLADIPKAIAKIDSTCKDNPVQIPLKQKKELLEGYNAIMWQKPQLQTSIIVYGDSCKKSMFVNSSGSLILQERCDVTLNIAAVASDGNQIQQASISVGSLGEFSAIQQLDEQIKEIAERASELLAAPQAKGGEHTVILDPVLAGVFVHEAFGHLSEADFIYENDKMRELMVLGKQFGRPELNIVDGALIPGLRGSYQYDDEGTPASKTYLIKDGILTSRLHSRETAAKMNEKPTGNARAVDYRHAPIVRMTNTYIEPGESSFEEMLSEIKDGIYARNWYGGTTSMEMFTFSAGEAYSIKNGKIGHLLRPVVLSGNVFQTLQNIDAIGNDLEMNQGGGCGKGNQYPLPVSNGSPHIRLQKCLIGGK